MIKGTFMRIKDCKISTRTFSTLFPKKDKNWSRRKSGPYRRRQDVSPQITELQILFLVSGLFLLHSWKRRVFSLLQAQWSGNHSFVVTIQKNFTRPLSIKKMPKIAVYQCTCNSCHSLLLWTRTGNVLYLLLFYNLNF